MLALISTIPFVTMVRGRVIEKIIKDEGDAIENMLWEAMSRALMVCITIENDKVYVGFVANPFESGFTRLKSISLIPSLSGYRDEKKSIEFTNYYEEIIEDVQENPKDYTISKSNVSVAIPLTRIVSISFFDPAIYHQFNE